VNEFLLGVTAMGCVVAALFFVRFWRSSGDRFFLWFSLGFATFAVNRTILATLDADSEERVAVYVLRLLAFLLILWAVVDKNRASSA
jgi:hypothetical protein